MVFRQLSEDLWCQNYICSRPALQMSSPRNPVEIQGSTQPMQCPSAAGGLLHPGPECYYGQALLLLQTLLLLTAFLLLESGTAANLHVASQRVIVKLKIHPNLKGIQEECRSYICSLFFSLLSLKKLKHKYF